MPNFFHGKHRTQQAANFGKQKEPNGPENRGSVLAFFEDPVL